MWHRQRAVGATFDAAAKPKLQPGAVAAPLVALLPAASAFAALAALPDTAAWRSALLHIRCCRHLCRGDGGLDARRHVCGTVAERARNRLSCLRWRLRRWPCKPRAPAPR